MGLMVIVCYKAREGQETALMELLRGHVEVLRGEGLATQRPPILMRDSHGAFVEVFEWCSEEAARAAHGNPVVLALWEQFYQACTFEAAATLPEFHKLFAHFVPLN